MNDETEMAIRALEARLELQEARMRALRELVQAVADQARVLAITVGAHAADLERASGAADEMQAQLSELKRLAP